MPRRISTRKLKMLIADEKKSSKEYRKYGFPKLAADERKHAKRLSMELKMRQRKSG